MKNDIDHRIKSIRRYLDKELIPINVVIELDYILSTVNYYKTVDDFVKPFAHKRFRFTYEWVDREDLIRLLDMLEL